MDINLHSHTPSCRKQTTVIFAFAFTLKVGAAIASFRVLRIQFFIMLRRADWQTALRVWNDHLGLLDPEDGAFLEPIEAASQPKIPGSLWKKESPRKRWYHLPTYTASQAT